MMEADEDGDGKLSFDEFKNMVASTDIAKQMVRVNYARHQPALC